MKQRHASWTALAVSVLAFTSTVHATITCTAPAGGTFKAGDPISLDWSSDDSRPTVDSLISIKGELFCNMGNKIADIAIANTTGPFSWVVPSVGNATTGGGTTGPCAANAFHIQYSGQYWLPLNIIRSDFGPVRCGTITINPAANLTVTATSAPVKTTTKATSSSSASPTKDAENGEKSGGSSNTVIIVGIIAGLIILLAVAGAVFHLKKQKRKRMENAIMPWSSNNNQFAKISNSMDDGHRPGGAAATAAAVGAGGAAAKYAGKPQPAVPEPAHGYYQEDDYGYANQHQHHPNQQGYGNNNYHAQGYEGYDEGDTYYNPYYTSQGQGTPGSTAMYYNNTPSSNHGGDPYGRSPYGQQPPYPVEKSPSSVGAGGTYFPPPPPTSNVPTSSPGLTSAPVSTTLSSSPRRGPQTILPEMGRPDEDEYPMKTLPSSPR